MQDLHSDDLTFWQNVDCYIDARQSLMIFYSNDFKEKILTDESYDIGVKLFRNMEETKNLALIVNFFKSVETLCYYIITRYNLSHIKNTIIFEKIRNNELNDVIECFSNKKIPSHNKKYFNVGSIEKISSYDDFVYEAIYLNENFKNQLLDEKRPKNHLSIPDFISICCKFYNKHKEFYNKYKHGNRVYPENITFEIEITDNKPVKLIENTMHHYFTEKDGVKTFNYLKITNMNLITCTINCCMICEFIRTGKLNDNKRIINFEIPSVDMGEHFSLSF